MEKTTTLYDTGRPEKENKYISGKDRDSRALTRTTIVTFGIRAEFMVLSYVNSIKTDNSTLTDAYDGGRINCYVRRPYFTDA